eukprot:1141854-Pelagomonas_calceolata.AAC.4
MHLLSINLQPGHVIASLPENEHEHTPEPKKQQDVIGQTGEVAHIQAGQIYSSLQREGEEGRINGGEGLLNTGELGGSSQNAVQRNTTWRDGKSHVSHKIVPAATAQADVSPLAIVPAYFPSLHACPDLSASLLQDITQCP